MTECSSSTSPGSPRSRNKSGWRKWCLLVMAGGLVGFLVVRGNSLVPCDIKLVLSRTSEVPPTTKVQLFTWDLDKQLPVTSVTFFPSTSKASPWPLTHLLRLRPGTYLLTIRWSEKNHKEFSFEQKRRIEVDGDKTIYMKLNTSDQFPRVYSSPNSRDSGN